MILPVVVAFGLLGLVLAAWEWARVVASAYEYFCRVLGVPQERAPKARSPRWFSARPLLGRASTWLSRFRRRRSSVRKAPPPPSNPPSHDTSPPVVDFGRSDYKLVALPVAVALDPDFDSFLGGVEAAVASGGILLIAVVVVMAIRRLVSF